MTKNKPEIVTIFEKGKDSITDKDNPETAMNTTYEVIRSETDIVDDIEVFEISDNQNEDQEVQTIEVVQDKIIPKLKGMFLSEGTDVFVITPNKRTFFFPETENLNFGDWNCLEIEDVLKFEYLEACKGKKAICGWLGQS